MKCLLKKDIYRFWTKKRLKEEIFLLKKTYNELFDSFLKLQEENAILLKKLTSKNF